MKKKPKGKEGATATGKSRPKAPVKNVVLLGGKRSQNMAIGLKRLKLSAEDVKRGLENFEGLALDSLELIYETQLIPTTGEVKKVQMYSGDPNQLADAEKYCLALADLADAQQRLSSLIFFARFDATCNTLATRIDVVDSACEQVKTSEKLQKLLQVVLLIGNKINSESKGAIRGFRLGSLLKLSQTKVSIRRQRS